jgi:phospholipase C
MATLLSAALSLLALGRPVAGGSLKDIEHVVIFMQENRSWNSVRASMLVWPS